MIAIEDEPTDDERLAGLKAARDAQAARVDPAAVSFVRAALEYETEKVRVDYRALAERNWHEIRVWSKRTFALMVVMLVSLSVLGWQTVRTTTAIQSSRRERINDSCERGNNFVAKLEEDITLQPPRERAKSLAALPETIKLVETLVPIGDCSKALTEAGL